MATHRGNDATLKIGNNVVNERNSFQVKMSTSTMATTTQGATWKTHKAGVNEWSAQVECYWDPADTNGQALMVVGASLTLNFYPADDLTGRRFHTGTGTITSATINSPTNDIVSVSYEIEGNGELTLSTVA